jgi:hypothetical protein
MRKETKKLQLKKLFKEFGFLKIDEEYKRELQAEYGPEFAQAIKKIFKEEPDLNLLFNSKSSSVSSAPTPVSEFLGIEIYNPSNTEQRTQNNEFGIEIFTGQQKSFESIKIEIPISDEVKKLYRKIATKTHPDKVSVKYLNDLYIKAQVAYEKDDIFTLYLICNDLDIDYEFQEDRLIEFKGIINAMHDNNSHSEQTYLWAWIHEENEQAKLNILKHYITTAYIMGRKIKI